jgi:hypothetical protein
MLRSPAHIQKMTLGLTTAVSSEVEFLFHDIPVPFQNTSFESGNPFCFAHAAQFRNEGREHYTLTEVSLCAGDSLWLFVDGAEEADFVGVDFAITESQPTVEQAAAPAHVSPGK